MASRGPSSSATRRRDWPETNSRSIQPELFPAPRTRLRSKSCDAVTAPGARRPTQVHPPSSRPRSTSYPRLYAVNRWMHRTSPARSVISPPPAQRLGKPAVAAAELLSHSGAARFEGASSAMAAHRLSTSHFALTCTTQAFPARSRFFRINASAPHFRTCTSSRPPAPPYSGSSCYGLSGSPQDAIKKGFAAQKGRAMFVPYLRRPADVRRQLHS